VHALPYAQLGRHLIEESSDCVKLVDLDGRIVYLNRAGVKALELDSADDLIGRVWVDVWEAEHRAPVQDAVAQAKAGDRAMFEGFCRTARGAEKWWEVVVTPVSDESGTVVQLLAVSRDITARRRDADFRAGQQNLLRMIATGAALDVVLTQLVRLVERHSDGMLCTVLLLDEDGVHLRQGAAPSLPESYNQAIDAAVIGPRAGSCGTAMYLGRTVISTDVLVDPIWEDYRELAVTHGFRACWSTPIFSAQKRVLGSFAMYYPEPRPPLDEETRLVEVAANIAGVAIEHQRALEALSRSEERNRAILRAIPDWMFILDANGVFLDFHAKDPDKLLITPEAFLGKQIQDVLPPVIANPLMAAIGGALAADEPQKFEYAIESDQTQRFYEACVVRCDRNRILSIVRDISDRKDAEMDAHIQRRELAHLSRVATLGELSGAIAHELSQPISAVLINAYAAKRLLAEEPLNLAEIRATIEDIISNDKRAGAVMERLRTLLKKGVIAFEALDLNDVARDVLDLTRSDFLTRRISVTTELDASIPRINGDRVQLQQVILNLILNACESMSANDPAERRLTVSTTLDDGFVHIAISDRGVGIPEDRRAVVFEPFVTFREQGLGLGLAISRSIVLAHDGQILAESNADRGATFRCLFPARPDSLAESAVSRREPQANV